MMLIAEYKTARRTNLAEVFNRIDAHERARRTILFARISLTLRARRIERRSLTKITFDRDRIVGRCGRRRTIDLETEGLLECCSKARRRRGRTARHHRDRVVRTLRRTVKTTDARLRLDVDVAVRVAKDRACRATRQTFRIRTVETNLRHERVLQTLLTNRCRTFDLDAAS